MRSLMKTRCSPKPDLTGPTQWPIWRLVHIGRKLFAKLGRNGALLKRIEDIIQHQRISHRREIRIAAGLIQLREQQRGVSRKVCAALFWIKVQLTEAELWWHAKCLDMPL